MKLQLYVLIFVIVALLAKICFDCYSFKEGMTGTDYSNTLNNAGKSFYNTWYNQFWSGGRNPYTLDKLNKWDMNEMKKYFNNDAAKPGEIVRVLVFNMRKSDVNLVDMNSKISTYLSDIKNKFKNDLKSALVEFEKAREILPTMIESHQKILSDVIKHLQSMISDLDKIEKTVDQYRTYMYDEREKIDPIYGAYEVVIAIDKNMEYTLNSVITKNSLELATSTQKPGSLVRIAEQAANQNLSEANFNKIMDFIEKIMTIRSKFDSIKPNPSTYTKNRLANFRSNLDKGIQKYIDIVFDKDPIYGAYLLCAQSIAMKNSIQNTNTQIPGISFTNNVMKTTFSESLNGSFIRKAEYGSRTTLVESTFNDVKQYLERAISFKREIIDKDLVKPQDNNQLKYWNKLKSGIEKTIQVYTDIMKNQDPIYGRYTIIKLWYSGSTKLLKDDAMKTIFSMTYNGSALKTAKFSNLVQDWKQYYAKSVVIQTLLNSTNPVDGNTQRLLNELKTEVDQSIVSAKKIIESDKQNTKEVTDKSTTEANTAETNTPETNAPETSTSEASTPETTVMDNQQRYNSILDKINILQTSYETHVKDSDTKLNDLINNNNTMFQDHAAKLDDIQKHNIDTMEKAEQVAREAASKAIEEQTKTIHNNTQEQKEETHNLPVEVSNIHESNKHAYNSSCPTVEVSSDCEKCKPVDEEYVRNDKCRNMYCNLIDSKDTDAYMYSCSPVMLDAANKIKAVCDSCPDKKLLSVPKTDQQKMFDHAQSERNHMIDYGWKEKGHYDMYDIKKAPSYGTGLFQDINLQNNSPFYENPFKASYPEMLEN